MRRPLHFEELEERIAPVIVSAGGSYSFLDSNGDHVTVSVDGPQGMQVTIRDLENMEISDGDNIGYLLITGSDATSTIRVSCDGAGGDDILIGQLITAPGQDVGNIILGYDGNGLTAGTVTLGTGADVTIGGELRLFAIHGGMDLGTARQTISAGGDIGAIFVTGDLHVAAFTGAAAITAGAGGGGNVDFLYVGGTIYDGTDMSTPELGTAFTGTALVHDDAGDGTAGSLTLKLSGTGATGRYWAVPVVGGGSVLSRVEASGDGVALLITGSGGGGDVTEIQFDGGASSAALSGVAGTDLLVASAAGSIASVVNKTSGGDIGAVIAEGDVALIQTGKLGNLGATCNGTGNGVPIFSKGPEIGLFTAVTGTIAKIQTGEIVDAGIRAGAIGSIIAGPGGIRSSLIMAGASIESVAASGVYGSQITTLGTLGTVAVGSGGIYDSMVGGLMGVSSVSVRGTIGSSWISAADEDTFLGGRIGSLTAEAVLSSRISAMAGIDSVAVKGAVLATDIVTEWLDGGTYHGGSIGAFSAGGLYGESTVQANTGISAIKIGSGGMSGDSLIDTQGAIGSLQVAGGVMHSTVEAAGGLGKVTVKGDIADSTITAATYNAGTPSPVDIGSVTAGAIYSSDITATGSIGLITVKGILADTLISAVGRDNGGLGVPVSGGAIAGIKALGQSFDTRIEAYGSIGRVTYGAAGMAAGATIETIDGDFAGLTTRGLVCGSIDVAGDLTGSVVTAGGDALFYGGVYHMKDANNALTDGTVTVGGVLADKVVVS